MSAAVEFERDAVVAAHVDSRTAVLGHHDVQTRRYERLDTHAQTAINTTFIYL